VRARQEHHQGRADVSMAPTAGWGGRERAKSPSQRDVSEVSCGMGCGQGRLLYRLLEGIGQQACAIAEIASRGEISVVVVAPSGSWRDALDAHGWNGEPVFAMSDSMRRAMSCADEVTERWIAGSRSGVARVFAVVDDDSLLVNCEEGLISIEPGSTDERCGE